MLDIKKIHQGVLAGNRAMIGRAITLIESRNMQHQKLAQELLTGLLAAKGRESQEKSLRVGISGVPGVGKSTFIEALGTQLTHAGHKVAVLAVDPSSGRTGGSILGDKTRMESLSVNPNAFIRPSPSAGVLGGVARASQETILLLETAGFDVILVETVGTGQSETIVCDMVDFFLVLMLPGAGDDLQGIKKGILEMADMIAVNKADSFEGKVKYALRDYKAALHILQDASPNWHPPVMPISGLTGDGLGDLWEKVLKHSRIMKNSGEWLKKRQNQRQLWMRRLLGDRLLDRFYAMPKIAVLLEDVERQVLQGHITPAAAVDILLNSALPPQE